MQSGYYFELLLFPSSAYIRRGRTLSSTQFLQYSFAIQFCNTILKQSFHMQVEGEVIEEHISDKEAAYQRCISARSCKSLSGQSHLGKLFERSTFMVDICKRSYIINAIKEYCLLGFFSLYRVSPGYMCC
jgi:hypothetical protein